MQRVVLIAVHCKYFVSLLVEWKLIHVHCTRHNTKHKGKMIKVSAAKFSWFPHGQGVVAQTHIRGDIWIRVIKLHFKQLEKCFMMVLYCFAANLPPLNLQRFNIFRRVGIRQFAVMWAKPGTSITSTKKGNLHFNVFRAIFPFFIR